MKPKSKDRLWAFLEASGVLANGTEKEIEEAKRTYRRNYEREYRRRYRSIHREVRFTVDQASLRSLRGAAAHEGIDLGTLAKRATLQALSGAPPPANMFNREALQTMALIHSEIRHLCRSRPSGFLERRVLYDRLEKRVSTLEETLRERLKNHL